MTEESKIRKFAREHNLEITLGSLVVIGVSGYLLTANVAAKAAAKETIRQFKRVPPAISATFELHPEDVAAAITKHMTVDESVIAARILQGITDVQRGAEVFLDARAV
jgi:hypothetical protein